MAWTRRRFWQGVVTRGWKWLSGATDHIGRFATVAALVGVPTGVAIWKLGWWAVAVAVAALALLMLAEGAFRMWREADQQLTAQRSQELSDELLHRKCVVLGAGVMTFATTRRATVPPVPNDPPIGPPDEELESHMAYFTHTQDTQSQYQHEFAADVFLLVERLRDRGYVSESDTEWLNFPKDLEGIERVGERLWELGQRTKPESWRGKAKERQKVDEHPATKHTS
jgi:hypothetical protein